MAASVHCDRLPSDVWWVVPLLDRLDLALTPGPHKRGPCAGIAYRTADIPQWPEIQEMDYGDCLHSE